MILLVYLVLTRQVAGLVNLNAGQWYWVIISSVLLLGYVLTWYKSLQYLPAVTVTSILVLASPITTALDLISTGKYNIYQVGGSLLILAATILLIYSFKKIGHVPNRAENFN